MLILLLIIFPCFSNASSVAASGGGGSRNYEAAWLLALINLDPVAQIIDELSQARDSRNNLLSTTTSWVDDLCLLRSIEQRFGLDSRHYEYLFERVSERITGPNIETTADLLETILVEERGTHLPSVLSQIRSVTPNDLIPTGGSTESMLEEDRADIVIMKLDSTIANIEVPFNLMSTSRASHYSLAAMIGTTDTGSFYTDFRKEGKWFSAGPLGITQIHSPHLGSVVDAIYLRTNREVNQQDVSSGGTVVDTNIMISGNDDDELSSAFYPTFLPEMDEHRPTKTPR
jgi:hypothetical protein